MKKIMELAAAAFGRETAAKNIEYRYIFVPQGGERFGSVCVG